jgi:hypothetical protein
MNRLFKGMRVLIVVLILGATAIAQNVEIVLQAVNGKNGKAIANHRLIVSTGVPGESARSWVPNGDLTTDKEGLATLMISAADTKWIQVWADFLSLCQSDPNGHLFSVSTIISKGLSAPNNCGPLRLKDTPGHFVVFARPATFIEKMRW